MYTVNSILDMLQLINALGEFAARYNISVARLMELKAQAEREGRPLGPQDLTLLRNEAQQALAELDQAIAQARSQPSEG